MSDALAGVVARFECHELIEAYTQAINTADLRAFVDLFCPDGVWVRSPSERLCGQESIEEFMLARPGNRLLRHVTGGIKIDLLSMTEAKSASQTLVFVGADVGSLPVSGPGLVKMVEYRDRLVRTSAGWRFAVRETTVVFAADGVW